MYTVTFQPAAGPDKGMETLSGTFETQRKAKNWVKFIAGRKFAMSVKLYRGQAGEELLETVKVAFND